MHCGRDFTCDEDRCRVHARHMSRNLARLTNEAIAIVRFQGRFRATGPGPTNTMSPGPGTPSTPSSIRPMPGPEITPRNHSHHRTTALAEQTRAARRL